MVSIGIASSSVLLSSALCEIQVDADSSYVDVSVEADGILLLSERYWTFNGSVTLWDISDIVENHMSANGIVVIDSLTITAKNDSESDSSSFPVLFCKEIPEGLADFDPAKNFLSTAGYRRIAPDSRIFLYLYAVRLDPELSVAFHFHDPEKQYAYKVVAESASAIRQDNLWLLDFYLKDVRDIFPELASVPEDHEILQVDCSAAGKEAHFVVDISLSSGSTYFFRNCFNCPDFIIVPAVTKTKTEVERSLARFGARAVFYDQNNERNYDVNTAPLSYDEGLFIDQLISSSEVYKIYPMENDLYVAQLILITESDCEISDDDQPDSIKYTWRYADNRMHRQLPADSLLRIFTSEFNRSFI